MKPSLKNEDSEVMRKMMMMIIIIIIMMLYGGGVYHRILLESDINFTVNIFFLFNVTASLG